MIKSPFPGLRPFETEEDHLFFGRDPQSDEILKRLRCNRFVAVVGTSGSGKSSLIKAGVLPSLHGGFMVKAGSRWRIAVFRPGDRPIHNLAMALSTPGVLGNGSESSATNLLTVETTLQRSGLGLVEAVRQARMPAQENLLIVVDQFEELFRFKSNRETEERERRAAAFVKLLIEAAKYDEVPIYVVITMRSDFLGHCARFRELPDLINEGLYLIPLMSRTEHREAIEGPVAVAGAHISPALVNRLLNDIGEDPEQLPIMQHALMRTWEHWTSNHEEGEPLDLRQYEAVGGMAEALSLHADEAYNELSEKHQEVAQKMFRALTEKRPGNPGVRRPTRVAELCAITEASEADVIAVVENFRRSGRSFLMPPPNMVLDADSLIDISHESLISGWKRLYGWVENEALSAAIYRRVADTAELYYRNEAGLWRDPDLKVALGWQEKARPNKAWGEHYHSGFEAAINFLKESKQAVEDRLAEREKQRRRALLRTRVMAGILAVFFVLATAAAGLAFRQNVIVNQQNFVVNEQKAVIVKGKEKAEELIKQLEREIDVRRTAEKTAQENELIADKARQDAEHARDEANEQKRFADRARDEAMKQEEITKQQYWALRLAWEQNLTDQSLISALSDFLISGSSSVEAVRWREIKAEALTTLGKHGEAEKELSEALKSFPDNTDLRMSRGYMYMLTDKIPESIEDFEFIIKSDPKSALAYLNKSISEGIIGNYKKASSSTQSAIDNLVPSMYDSLYESELCPEVSRAARSDKLVATENAFGIALHYQLANIQAFQGADDFVEKLESAKKQPYKRDAYLTAINWAWLHMRVRKEDYGGLASQGAIWEKLGNCRQAIDAYKRFQEEHKKLADVRYAKLADWVKQRLRIASKSCRIQPDEPADTDELIFYATIAYDHGSYEDADNFLTEAIAREPENLYVLLKRAEVRNRLNRFSESKDDALEVLKLAHGKPVPQASLLIALASDEDRRVNLLQDLIKEYPNQVEALSWLSLNLEKKNPDEAIRLLERAAKLQPLDADFQLRKADLQINNKRYREALDSIKAVIAIDRDEAKHYVKRMDIEKKLASNAQEIARIEAIGYEELGDIMVRRQRSELALEYYGKSLRALASILKENGDANLKCDMAATIHKMGRFIERQESRDKASATMKRLKAGFVNSPELQTLFDDEIKRLSSGAP